MPDSHEFVDYYDILQVNPNCDVKIIESAYRHLAKIYHPDHEETADVSRFTSVIEAYNALKFPDKRENYDIIYKSRKGQDSFVSEPVVSSEIAISDAVVQKNILSYLYKRKRENFSELGVAPYYIQHQFDCFDEIFNFHIWYLKSKGFVEATEQGTLSITALGVDHVISIHQPANVDKYLTDQSRSSGG